MEGLFLFLFILFGSAGCCVIFWILVAGVCSKLPSSGGYTTSDSPTSNSTDDRISAYKARQRAKRQAEYIASAQKNGGRISANDEIVIDRFYGNIDD